MSELAHLASDMRSRQRLMGSLKSEPPLNTVSRKLSRLFRLAMSVPSSSSRTWGQEDHRQMLRAAHEHSFVHQQGGADRACDPGACYQFRRVRPPVVGQQLVDQMLQGCQHAHLLRPREGEHVAAAVLRLGGAHALQRQRLGHRLTGAAHAAAGVDAQQDGAPVRRGPHLGAAAAARGSARHTPPAVVLRISCQ